MCYQPCKFWDILVILHMRGFQARYCFGVTEHFLLHIETPKQQNVNNAVGLNNILFQSMWKGLKYTISMLLQVCDDLYIYILQQIKHIRRKYSIRTLILREI